MSVCVCLHVHLCMCASLHVHLCVCVCPCMCTCGVRMHASSQAAAAQPLTAHAPTISHLVIALLGDVEVAQRVLDPVLVLTVGEVLACVRSS